MLYYLHEWFHINLLGYISVRAGFAFFIAFFLALILVPRYLVWAISRKANQPINKYVPAHEGKQHTPTMGGAVFVVATLMASLLSANLHNAYTWGGAGVLSAFAAIGIKDDLGKILTGDNLRGLTGRGKIGLQLIVSLVVSAWLVWGAHFPTTFYLPFLKNPIFDLGIVGGIVFWTLIMIAASNAVNLTDGLDGLATIPSVVALGTLSIIVYLIGHAGFAG
jgi:phospho-N-acetylmuramoyl-pentapeptide-transferase